MHGVVDLDHPSVFDMPRPRANRPSVTSPVALPAGWSMVEAPGGRPFYRNNLSGVTQWHPPPLALPPGWVEQTTPDGTSFFLNTLTKVTQWERPTVVPPAVESPPGNAQGNAATPSTSTSSSARIWVILPHGMSQLDFGEIRDTDGKFKPVPIEKGKHAPESRKVLAHSRT